MAHRRVHRRLAAILAADVVGYSSLMGADEEGTHGEVKRLRSAVVEPLLKDFEGRLIKTTGDGFLFEFGSIFDAFAFAAAIQARCHEDQRLQLRMGLNLGDVIIDEGDVFGDGVNVAARLEPLSPPGGLLVSQRAWEDLRRLPVAFDDAGDLQLKNIKNAQRAWRVEPSELHKHASVERGQLADDQPPVEPISAAKAWLPVSRRTALIGGTVGVAALGFGGWTLFKPGRHAADGIAVLPFANLSGDPAQAYFSDGIAEELRSALGRVAGLQVVGRISSEAVADADAQTASKKLGVPNVLTGSVRRTESTVRVSAQLIDGRTGIEKWSQHYDRAPGDAIKIQTDIALSVAQALSIALGRVGRAALAAGQTANAAAYNLVMQARQIARRGGGRPAKEQALALIDQATALDPGYANAYALKSMMLNNLANGAASAAEMPLFRAQALELANKAIALAPRSAGGHAALAMCRINALDVGGADAAFRQAIRLAPSQVDVLGSYVVVVSAVNPIEGVALAERVLALDPLNHGLQIGRISAMYFARRYAEVIEQGQALERKAPDIYPPSDSVAFALILLGKLGDARTYLRRQFGTEDWQRVIGEILIDIRGGNRTNVPQAIAKAKQLYGSGASYQYGQIYAQLGDKDRAFAALDDAWNSKDVGLFILRSDAMIDPLRSDPRFKVIERKLNFP